MCTHRGMSTSEIVRDGFSFDDSSADKGQIAPPYFALGRQTELCGSVATIMT